jgi:hypothetical protein
LGLLVGEKTVVGKRALSWSFLLLLRDARTGTRCGGLGTFLGIHTEMRGFWSSLLVSEQGSDCRVRGDRWGQLSRGIMFLPIAYV